MAATRAPASAPAGDAPARAGAPRRRASRREVAAGAAAIAAIAGTAAWLRFWRIGWGLEHQMAFPDEMLAWRQHLTAFVPLRLESFLPQVLVYPSLYGFLAGGAVALAHAAGFLPVPSSALIDAVLIGRQVSAVAGLVTVLLVGIFAARAYGGRAGFAAAALMAVLPLEALQVHYMSCDVLVATCTAATLLLSLQLVRDGRIRWAIAAGIAAGLAAASKYTAAIVLAAPAWAAIEVAWRGRSVRALVALGGVCAVAAAVGFATGCPQCVLRPDLMLAPLGLHYGRVAWVAPAAGNNFIAPSLGWYASPGLYQTVATFPWAMGWPFYALAVLGFGWALRRREDADRLLVVAFATGFAAMAQFEVTYPRYYMPLYPMLALLAARFVAAGPLLPRVGAAVLAVAWGYTLVLSASQVARFSYDQQLGVARWIADAFAPRIARGEPPRIAVPEFFRYTRISMALAKAGLSAEEVRAPDWLASSPEVFVMPDWLATELRRDRPEHPAIARLDALEAGSAGYRPAAVLRSRYLHQELYTGLDPAFAADLWQGEIGFTVYVREDLLGSLARAEPPDAAAVTATARGPGKTGQAHP